MPLRSRSRYGYHTGTYNEGPTSARSFRENTQDVTGPGDCQVFSVDRATMEGLTLTGSYSGGSRRYVDAPSTTPWSDAEPWRGHLAVSGLQTNSYYASKVLSRTNPSRASINSVVSGIELRETPGLIKDLYSYRLKLLQRFLGNRKWRWIAKGGKTSLLVQFGIAPLVSDLATLPLIAESIDQRQRELTRMRTRGLRRTIELDKGSAFDQDQITVWSASGSSNTASCRRIRTTCVNVRGHVRWHSISPLPTSDKEMRQLARKAVLGLSIGPETVYELMPWSWLVDYFTNVGDIVSSYSNVIPAHHGPVCIMRHTLTETAFTNPSVGNPNMKMSSGYATLEQKRRDQASPSISASLELLTAQQTSIIGSLSISKLR